MTLIRAIFVAFCVPLNALAEPTVPDWTVITESSSVEIRGEAPAANGDRALSIAGSVGAFGEGTKFMEVTRENFGWIDSLYLLQTINARDYKGKHIHVSAYMRIDHSRAEKLIQKYKEILPKSPFFEKRFSKKFDNLPSFSESTLVAFLHGERGIVTYRGYFNAAESNDQWQRINLEIGVGGDVNAITVGYYQKGVGVGFVDHFAVVEHGPTGKTGSSYLRDETFTQKLRGLEENTKQKYEFTNLSFER